MAHQENRTLDPDFSHDDLQAILSSVRCMDAQALLTCQAKEHLASLYVSLLEGFLQKAAIAKAPLSRDAIVVAFLHSLLDALSAKRVVDDRVARKLKVFVYRGVLCGT